MANTGISGTEKRYRNMRILTKEVQISGSLGTGSDSASVLKLTTPETTVVDADQLGRIEFSAPAEASGTDAILTAAYIAAEADDTFSATVNDTDIVFGLGVSEAATTKFRMSSAGHFHPETNDGGALGISGTAWADLFLASAGVINFNAGNYTVTHSAGVLTTNGALALTSASATALAVGLAGATNPSFVP
jgi:hypothetical protein